MPDPVTIPQVFSPWPPIYAEARSLKIEYDSLKESYSEDEKLLQEKTEKITLLEEKVRLLDHVISASNMFLMLRRTKRPKILLDCGRKTRNCKTREELFALEEEIAKIFYSPL